MHNIEVTILSPTLKEIGDLIFEDHHAEAVRRLRAYLKRAPSDPEALCLLASSFNLQRRDTEALDAATAALTVQPDHLRALCIAANALVALGRAEEALPLVERAIRVYDALPLGEQRASGPSAQRRWLSSIHWWALDAVGEPEAALEVARQGFRVDRSMEWYVRRSLVKLGRFEEAEHLSGPEPTPAEYAQALWDIGFTLVDEERYAEASPYLLRNLAFASLPKDFSDLQAYLECLACADRHEELSKLCLHWLEAGRVRWGPHRRSLQALLAIAYQGLGQFDRARECVLELCQGRTVDRCARLFRGRNRFEVTGVAIRRLLEQVLGSRASADGGQPDSHTARHAE